MIDALLALVPDHGIAVVAGAVFLSCLAVPLPASILVLTAGGFAAAGDLSPTTLAGCVWIAFVLGDQVAYRIAKAIGRPLIDRLRDRRSVAPVLARGEDVLARRGAIAVVLAHTVLSPTCPYVTYLCGAGGLPWHRFTAAAVTGAALWTTAYLGLGFVFATRLEQVATLLGDFFGAVLAGCALVGLLFVLRDRWRKGASV